MVDLKSILINVDGFTDAQLRQTAQRWYEEVYLQGGNRGTLKAHDGVSVHFYANNFDHTFYTSSDRIRRPDDKDKACPVRIGRVRWLQHVIAGNIDDWECRLDRSNPQRVKRLYLVESELYVIWLEPTKNVPDLRLGSAYVASRANFDRYRQRSQFLAKGKKNAP